MKIGIVTQPLQGNYGGYLQNYALQQILKQLGHDPITIDYGNRISLWRYICSSVRSVIFLFLPNKRRPFARFIETQRNVRKDIFNDFLVKNINKTEDTNKYRPSYIWKYELDAVITGSDQVWRPQYNRYLEDMFLRFVHKDGVKKIAYAASFGTDDWEYSEEQTVKCTKYAKRLDAISVREQSGVRLCREFLGVEASLVLDPTLLLSSSNYNFLCELIDIDNSHFLAAYILDRHPSISIALDQIARSLDIRVKVCEAEENSTLSVEEWLAVYRDAKFVITDSFHGTVFSVLFNKPFVCLGNRCRGNARFYSLLKMLGLEERLILDINDALECLNCPIDWQRINMVLKERREDSIKFLLETL